MRTEIVTYEVYKVDELSDKAKDNAYWNWLKFFEYDFRTRRKTTLIGIGLNSLNMTHPTMRQR